MSFSPLDSELLGPLFRTEAMADVFSDTAFVRAMLAVEAALARAEAAHGLVPEALPAALAAIDPEDLDLAELGRGTALAGVPAIPFVKAVQ
jgi:3-carboxy-cis,cis-muconate cycloisomerase